MIKPVQQRLQEIGLTPQQSEEAIGVFLQYLPDPVDINGKYEALKGINIAITGDKDRDVSSLDYLAHYGEDNGYNRYYIELLCSLDGNPSHVNVDFKMGERYDEEANNI